MGSSAIGTMATVVAGVTLLAFATVAHAALGKYTYTSVSPLKVPNEMLENHL